MRPPLYTPRISTDFEVPTIVKLDERYYLIGHICAPMVDVYRVADSYQLIGIEITISSALA